MDVADQLKPRGTRADWASADEIGLFKRVSRLRATYQVRLLLYFAIEQGRRLVIVVPAGCFIDGALEQLGSQFPGRLVIRRS